MISHSCSRWWYTTCCNAPQLRCGAYCGPALTGWSTVYWSSPYGLDQYALQALRPEVQKERVDSVKSSLRLDFTVYTNFLFKKKVGQRKVHVDSGLTAWVHFYTHLRPYGLRCVCISGLTARNAKNKEYTIPLFFWKKKSGQKKKQRDIWAVRPRYHSCPSGKRKKIIWGGTPQIISQNVESACWFHVLVIFRRLSIENLRLPSTTHHQCTQVHNHAATEINWTYNSRLFGGVKMLIGIVKCKDN